MLATFGATLQVEAGVAAIEHVTLYVSPLYLCYDGDLFGVHVREIIALDAVDEFEVADNERGFALSWTASDVSARSSSDDGKPTADDGDSKRRRRRRDKDDATTTTTGGDAAVGTVRRRAVLQLTRRDALECIDLVCAEGGATCARTWCAADKRSSRLAAARRAASRRRTARQSTQICHSVMHERTKGYWC